MSKNILLSKPDIGPKEKKAVMDVLNSGIIASGPKVKELEERFSKVVGTKYAVAVSSGTTALHASLIALGVGKGDNVLTTPFSFIATSNSILFTGAKPIFADIDPRTFNLDPNKVEDILKKKKIKAIIIVHLYGLPCDMKAFKFLSAKYNVPIIEDCAQSIGATYKNKMTGSFGITGCFSLYATKNITSGEGGIVTTNNKHTADKIRSIINHGRSGRFAHSSLGYNFRMTDISAAIGVVQLERLNELTDKRIENSEYISKSLNNQQ